MTDDTLTPERISIDGRPQQRSGWADWQWPKDVPAPPDVNRACDAFAEDRAVNIRDHRGDVVRCRIEEASRTFAYGNWEFRIRFKELDGTAIPIPLP